MTDFLMGSTLSGSYDAHDKRQVNRATIGEGTIIIRSDPAQGLAGLNRDLQKAQELTKDSKTSVTVYVDPAAVKELKGIADKVVEAVQKARADAKTQERLQNAKLPDDLKHLEDKNGLAVMKAMISAGGSDEEINKLLHDKGYQDVIAMASDVEAAISKYGAASLVEEILSARSADTNTSSASDANGAQGPAVYDRSQKAHAACIEILRVLLGAKAFYDSVPYKEEATLALTGLLAVLQGPEKVLAQIGQSVAVDTVAGDTIESGKNWATNKALELLAGHNLEAEQLADNVSSTGTPVDPTGEYWKESLLPATRFGLEVVLGVAGVVIGSGKGGAADARGGTAAKGSVADANFAQSTIRASEAFSKDGIANYSQLAGRPINTVDDLAAALQSGAIKPSQVPVDYVVATDGTKLILNTRTSVALDRAGVPKSDWYGTNKTGVSVPERPGTTFDDLAADQLKNNKLPSTGTPTMPKGRKR